MWRDMARQRLIWYAHGIRLNDFNSSVTHIASLPASHRLQYVTPPTIL